MLVVPYVSALFYFSIKLHTDTLVEPYGVHVSNFHYLSQIYFSFAGTILLVYSIIKIFFVNKCTLLLKI